MPPHPDPPADCFYPNLRCQTAEEVATVSINERSFMISPSFAEESEVEVGDNQEPAPQVAGAQAGPHAGNLSARELVPPTSNQERLWFLNQIDEGRRAKNTVGVIRIEGALDRAMLGKALDEVLRRHEILRANFVLHEGRPRQRVRPAPDAAIEIHAADGSAGGIEPVVEQMRRHPFDLAHDRLIRAMLVPLETQTHALVVGMAAIVGDRRSIEVITGELAENYRALSAKTERVIPPVPLQFADFAGEEPRRWQDEATRRAAAYWRADLAGMPPVLELPFDFARGAASAATGLSRSRELSEPLSRAIKLLAWAEGSSLFETLLAAWQTLLQRWTSQADIVVGSFVDVRGDGQADLVGPCSELVALRADTSGTPSFVEMLSRTRERVAKARASQLPFARLLQELDVPSALDRHPVCQVLLELYESPPPSLAAGPVSLQLVAVHGDATEFDLALAVTPGRGGLRLTLESGRGLFAPETLDRLLSSFETLLEGIAAEPRESLARLPVLPASERQHLVRELNDTALPYDRTACIHELFGRQAKQTPDAIAVVGSGERWTYARLDAEAERLAAILRQEGVGPDVLVGIYLRRTPRLLAGMLGILKAGGAYVPLDPAYPAERMRFIIEDTQMPVLVTEQELLGDLAPGRAKIVNLDELPRAQPTISPPGTGRTKPDNLAYVIYTSGSTGRPKGVCVTQQGVVALIAWAQARYTRDELCGLFFSTSACFDVSVFESLAPLCLGGKIIVAGTVLDIATHEARDEVVTVSGVPSAVAEVVRARSLPPSVRTVNLAGEPCPQSLVDDLYALGHVERVYDVYGPTETTVYSIGGLRRAQGVPSIGRPLPNERVYLLDANQQLVPKGVRGELYIGGEKLARGYLNRPELSAERFVTVPCLPGERLYRTGDAARWFPDGTLEFLGRLDRQVKVRGFRVEPGEVEAALRPHPMVKECAVVPRDDAMGAKMLVAYVVGAVPDPDLAVLRRFLEERLPEYLVPSALVKLDALPRSPNGKLDVRALPAPALTTGRETSYAPPRDGVEQQLVRVWEDVLAVKPIGIHDRFFDLGGHSLLAVRMLAQVERKFGRKVPVSILFRAPTIERLAQAIRKDGLIAARSSLVEIQPHGNRPPIFWLHTLGGGGGAGLFRYAKLAEKLGPDQPSYGLIASNEKQPDTFEALAARYVGEIRAVQPAGPYHLGGYCFGGVLAYEVARQLAAAGDRIALVVLLDAAPPNLPQMPRALSRTYLRHLGRTLPAWTWAAVKDRHGLAQRMSTWSTRALRRLRVRDRQQTRSRSPGPALEDVINMDKYPAEYRAHAEAHWRAVSRYQPRFFPCNLALIRPNRPRLLMLNPEEMWRVLGHDVEVTIVPGNHDNLLAEPEVDEVAKAITAILDRQHANSG
ncbi:MAG TPA: amino acid adenylation domain-containing protein [Lacunisphaera sp.]|nr:amino acid adenylation domain-containing protein [Lacunisphaera sp.]